METSPLANAAASEGANAARADASPAGNLPEMLTISAVCAFWGGRRATKPRDSLSPDHRRPAPAPDQGRLAVPLVAVELLAERERRMAARAK